MLAPAVFGSAADHGLPLEDEGLLSDTGAPARLSAAPYSYPFLGGWEAVTFLLLGLNPQHAWCYARGVRGVAESTGIIDNAHLACGLLALITP